jgi:glycogen debranching enzyme
MHAPPLHLLLAVIMLSLAPACASLPQQSPAQTGSRHGSAAPRPTLEVNGMPYWAAGFDAVNDVLLRNLNRPGTFHRTRHARAAPSIRGVHLWDSAFMSHVWNAWDVRVAQDVILAVLNRADEGRIPHFSHRLRRSELTQPPVIAWAVWENHLWSADTAYLRVVYPPLREYNAWLYENRRLPSGLFFWRSPLESGMDNSPRFGSPRNIDRRDVRALAAIDLSSYMVLDNRMLGRIAAALGHPAEAAFYDGRARELRDLINDLLWDEEAGFYFDRDESAGQLVRVRTAASLVTLFAGVPDTARARLVLDHVMDPAAFNSLIPLPSVALDEPDFSKDMWRGPVWINVSYMIVRGLDSYGFARQATELAFRTIDGVFRTHQQTAGVWEFYDPERFDLRELNRKRGHLSKQLTLGNRPLANYGWTGLVNMLIIEQLVGYRPDPDHRGISPRLPGDAASLRIRLTLPGEGTEIRLTRMEDGSTRAEVGDGERLLDMLLPEGQHLLLPRPAAPGEQH